MGPRSAVGGSRSYGRTAARTVGCVREEMSGHRSGKPAPGLFPGPRRGPSHQTAGLEVNKMGLPVAKFRAGQVSCALWENEATVNGRAVTMLRATLERRYKHSSGEWRSTNSFSRTEIPLAIYCLQKAFESMLANQESKQAVPEEDVR